MNPLTIAFIALFVALAALGLAIYDRWVKPLITREDYNSSYAHFDKDDNLINSQKR